MSRGACIATALPLLLARWALGAPVSAVSRPLDCEYTLELLRRAGHAGETHLHAAAEEDGGAGEQHDQSENNLGAEEGPQLLGDFRAGPLHVVVGLGFAAGDHVVSMSIIRHFEADPAERAAYLKQRRLMAGVTEDEADDGRAPCVSSAIGTVKERSGTCR